MFLLIDFILIICNKNVAKRKNIISTYKDKIEEITKQKSYRLIKNIFLVTLILFIIYIPFGLTAFFLSIPYMIIDNGEKINTSLSYDLIVFYCLYISYVLFMLKRIIEHIKLRKFLTNNL